MVDMYTEFLKIPSPFPQPSVDPILKKTLSPPIPLTACYIPVTDTITYMEK